MPMAHAREILARAGTAQYCFIRVIEESYQEAIARLPIIEWK
jgi:hypothetical protein